MFILGLWGKEDSDSVSDTVSVIIPVYNSQEYIDRCVSSVLKQTYNNIEVILVNDGSTDGSLGKCESWKKKDRRVRILDKENEGLGFTRNAGVRIAGGKYITFIDSDDWVEEEYVEKLLFTLQQYNGDMSVCDIYYYDAVTSDKSISKIRFNKKADSFMQNRSVINKVRTFAWGKLFKKELFGEDTLFPRHMYEDMAFSARMAYKSGLIVHVDEPLYYYVRNRNNSITQNINSLRDLPKSFKLLYGIFDGCGEEAMLEVKKLVAGQLRFAYRKCTGSDLYVSDPGVSGILAAIRDCAGELFPELGNIPDKAVYGSNDAIKTAINLVFPLQRQICDDYRKADYVIIYESESGQIKNCDIKGKLITLQDNLYNNMDRFDVWEAAEYIMENL